MMLSVNDTDGHGPMHLPEDLMHFIRRETYSLLVKGFAGTGKTTLALTILNALGSQEQFLLHLHQNITKAAVPILSLAEGLCRGVQSQRLEPDS